MRTCLRRPAWPLARHNRLEPPAWLSELARHVAQAVPDTLRGRLDVTYGVPQPGEYSPDHAYDRVWLAYHDACVTWCIVDATSCAALLALIIGGPGAQLETPIERAIVGEAVERLLCVDDSRWAHWSEAATDRPKENRMWRCNVEVTRSGRMATLQLLTPIFDREPTPAAHAVSVSANDIGAVRIGVRAELSPIAAPLAQILTWAPGSTVALHACSLNHVALAIERSVIATGRLGSIGVGANTPTRAIEIDRIAASSAA